MIRTFLNGGVPAEEIVENESFSVSLACVQHIIEEMEKENQIDDTKRKEIRSFLEKDIDAQEIATLMNLPLEKVLPEVELIVNSTKKEIEGSKLY